jgi:hypothetical protein
MEKTYYKLAIGGIVYLVDPITSTAYTYDLKQPTAIGTVIWSDAKSEPRLQLYDNWQQTLTEKMTQAVQSGPQS